MSIKGVAQCLSPRDLNINKLRFTSRTWVHDLAAKVHTGDIVLFSSKHGSSFITKFFTQSGWDHIGIVVKPSASQVFLLEWGGGLFVCPFVERLVEYYECDGRLITLRQLQLPRNRTRVEDQMEEFVDMLLRSGLGSNAAVPFKEVLRAAKLQNSSKDLNSNEAVVDNLEELFCSKTVAVCYKAAGLIAPQRDASTFLPKHFSIDHDKFVDLQGGASLGPEIDISFEPKSVRRFTVAFLALANPMDRKKTRAAEVIQAYARRWQARTEVAARRRKPSATSRGSACQTPLPTRTGQERRSLLMDISKFDADRPRPPLAPSLAGVPEQPKGD